MTYFANFLDTYWLLLVQFQINEKLRDSPHIKMFWKCQLLQNDVSKFFRFRMILWHDCTGSALFLMISGIIITYFWLVSHISIHCPVFCILTLPYLE